MVTIKDIAKELGLSHSVVSRALNPNPDKNARVSLKTKQLVEDKAKEMGYQPNRIAEFMKRGRSAAIGVFLPEYSNRLMSDLFMGISESAVKFGFPLNFYFGMNYDSYASFINKNIKSPSSGIISYPFNIESNSDIDELFKTYISAGGNALMLNTERDQIVPVLSMDEGYGSRCAADCLIARNCRHYYVANGMQNRIVPFMQYMNEKGLPCSELKLDNLGGLIQELEQQSGLPVGIFATTDDIALYIMNEVGKSNLQIGTDIFLVGYDDLQYAGQLSTPLTTIHQPFRAQGVRAVEKIVSMMYGSVENDELVTPYLVNRDSA